MSAVFAVVGRRQEWKGLGYTVRGYVYADRSGCAGEEIDAVADMCGDVILSPNHADRDVGDVVVGAAPVRPARFVRAQRRAETTLSLWRGRRHPQVQPQKFGAGNTAIGTAQGLARVFEQNA